MNLTHVCFRNWFENATLKWAKARICHPHVDLKHDFPLRKMGLKLTFGELFQFKQQSLYPQAFMQLII